MTEIVSSVMNKKIGLCAGLLLLALPACQPKRRTVPTETDVTYREVEVTHGHHGTHTVVETEKPAPKNLIVEDDVEGFVLEDDKNTFNIQEESEEEDVALVEPEIVDDAWIDKRLEQAQEHGFKTVYFNYDDASLRPDQKASVDYNIKKILELTRKGTTIIVEGHACHLARNTEYNMMLSERRAVTVVNYLVSQGVDAARLKSVGRGDLMCKVPDGDIESQWPNRRVEFLVLDQESQEQVTGENSGANK